MRALAFGIVFMCLGTSGLAEGPEGGSLSLAQTARVTDAITSVFDACAEIEEVYQPDCTARALQRGAAKVANNPDFWEAHVTLTRVSRSLDALVRENADPDAWRKKTKGYRLRAVLESALPELRALVTQIFARANDDLQRVSAAENRAFAPLRELLAEGRPWP